MSSTLQPIRVFYSYAHADEKLRDELAKHLSLLKNEGYIHEWHDRDIEAGQEWEHHIDHHLETAHLILLLISPDFMASRYCYSVEMQRAVARHKAGEARVVPVILKPVDWQGAPFGKLQALPKDAKPVTTWPNQDEALLDVARGIRRAVEALRGSAKPASASPTPSIQPAVAPSAQSVGPHGVAIGGNANGSTIITGDKNINTGGGAYIGGNVNTGGGSFVGRDQYTVTAPETVNMEELQSLVAELGELIRQARLPAEIGEIVEGDWEQVKQQTAKDKPNGTIVKNRLGSLKELLSGADAAAGSVEKILAVLGKAAQLAGLLFP